MQCGFEARFLYDVCYMQYKNTASYTCLIIGVRDEGDKDREDHKDEQRDEGVEVDLGKHPGRNRRTRHLQVCGKHVVSIEQREQTL